MRVARWPAGWGHVPAVPAWQVREAKGIMTCARVLEKGHRQASLPRPWKEWRNFTRKRPKRPHPNGLDESYCNWLGEEPVGGSPHTVLQHGPESRGAPGELELSWLVERSRAAGEGSRGARDSAERGRNQVGHATDPNPESGGRPHDGTGFWCRRFAVLSSIPRGTDGPEL